MHRLKLPNQQNVCEPAYISSKDFVAEEDRNLWKVGDSLQCHSITKIKVMEETLCQWHTAELFPQDALGSNQQRW